jgi:seryl-tRNA synthetase
MIDITLIRENPEAVKKSLKARGLPVTLVDSFLTLDHEWREVVAALDEERGALKRLSVERNIPDAKRVKEKIKASEEKLRTLEAKRNEILFEFPNLLSEQVPEGKNADQNVVLKTVGEKPKHKPQDYLALAEQLDLIDIPRAAKVSGSRFGYLKREAVLLEFALVRLAFDMLTKEGFIPVIPPVMVKLEPYRGMGRLSKDQVEERYHVATDDLYLAGSAEHTIGPMHMDEVFEEKDLPRRYVGFSTCFRREAGSYGKDTKGILRVHQFDKVEMFSFTKPDESEQEHQFLLSMQEKLMAALELPYRVVELCAGELAFTDARAFDIETWIPSEGKYRETHSCSNTTDFQARGVNVKFRKALGAKHGATGFVHMLNATGIAIGRTLIAILENHQTKEGIVKLPKALAKYAGFDQIG